MSATDTAFRTDYLETPDGVRVATYTWAPGVARGREEPERGRTGATRAIVQIVHGAAEYALRYDRFARLLASEGYVVVAADLRGHGATAEATGGYGVVGEDSWRLMVSDLRALSARARADHPGAPLVLFGHSLGSMLARDYAQEHGDELAGLMLSGTFRTLPGVEIDELAAHIEREIAERGRTALSTFTPTLFALFNDPYEFGTGFEWLSRDPEAVEAYAADERCGFPFSAGLSLDWVRAVRKINNPRNQARIPPTLPVHIAVGTEDPCNQRMTLVYELLEDFRYIGTRDLTWKGYPGARHEILNETNRAQVEADLLAWLETRI
ncbi:alpha/beta fold hydrolase [Streptomyces sp. SAJ15]|uniref:alpha/beta fold hydrolase n=1 Tax=Streptomyces sp. SAJ15 TaxID=2011095 RepID=UPI001185A5FE|nr:alpha/beta hydrolase [Streptomyces sp. SAJ15]TVL90456.1 lysophospholipase [Streptomyces sp. SAJ15]